MKKKINWEVQDDNNEVLSSRILMRKILDLKKDVSEMGLETSKISKAQVVAVEIGLYLQKLLKVLSDDINERNVEYFSVREVIWKVNMGQSTTYHYLKVALDSGLITSRNLSGLKFDNNAIEVIKKIKSMVVNGDSVSHAVEKLKRAKGDEQNVQAHC